VLALMGSCWASPAVAADGQAPRWVASELVTTKLTDELEATLSGFGAALAVRRSVALVGAPEYSASEGATGAVFVFERGASGWRENAPLLAPIGWDDFGRTLAMSDDYWAISALNVEGTAAHPIHVVARADPTQGVDLEIPLDAEPSAFFGYSLLAEKDRVLVGDPLASAGQGRVYVYRQQAGAWALEHTLPEEAASLGLENAMFGASMAFVGASLVVGAPGKEGAGAVYTFERASETSPLALATPLLPTPAASVMFGWSVAGDASTGILAVGDSGFKEQSGVAYVFERGAGGWSAVGGPLRASANEDEITPGEGFGHTLVFSQHALLVGAPSRTVFDGADALGPGALLTFFNSGQEWLHGGPLTSWAAMGEALAGSPGGSSGPTLAKTGGRVHAYTLEQGLPCQVDGDCHGGICSQEAVCCDSTCDGICESCLAELTEEETGACAPVVAGTDPDDECDESGSICGNTGACSGARSCASAPRGQLCNAAACDGPAIQLEVVCDGSGNCPMAASVACGEGFICADGACEREPQPPSARSLACMTSDDCDADFYCLEGECVVGARCATEEAAAYAADGTREECLGSVCVDGACLRECRATRTDCQVGYVCDLQARRCIAVAALSTTRNRSSVACVFSVGSSHSGLATLVCAGLLFHLWLRRRRHSKDVLG
jgi:hypothetical protein